MKNILLAVSIAALSFTALSIYASGNNRETEPYELNCYNNDGSVCSYGSDCRNGESQCWANTCNKKCNSGNEQ